MDYKRKYSPKTHIQLLTNNIDIKGEKRKKILLLPPEVQILGSRKDIRPHNHKPMNVAPVDIYGKYKIDFSNAFTILDFPGPTS